MKFKKFGKKRLAGSVLFLATLSLTACSNSVGITFAAPAAYAVSSCAEI